MSRKVLVVDDEKLIVKGIRFSLEQDGMEVDCAYDGEEALQKAKDNEYDIILLDVMLPKLTGFEVCQQIREFSNVPVVMLTAKGEDMDKILGLEYGADDYITKPFSVVEVLARIRALIRRTTQYDHSVSAPPEGPKLLQAGSLTMNLADYTVTKKGAKIDLTAKEFEILKLLVKNPKKVYTKEQIYSSVWNDAYVGDENAVNVHISRLRNKIEDNPRNPKYIITVWGIGYRLGEEE